MWSFHGGFHAIFPLLFYPCRSFLLPGLCYCVIQYVHVVVLARWEEIGVCVGTSINWMNQSNNQDNAWKHKHEQIQRNVQTYTSLMILGWSKAERYATSFWRHSLAWIFSLLERSLLGCFKARRNDVDVLSSSLVRLLFMFFLGRYSFTTQNDPLPRIRPV